MALDSRRRTERDEPPLCDEGGSFTLVAKNALARVMELPRVFRVRVKLSGFVGCGDSEINETGVPLCCVI